MAGHVKKGRVYKSPLAATGVLSVENWIKDDLPDLLWPALVLAERGNGAARMFMKWQEAVQKGLSHHGETGWVSEVLDGRLTNLAVLAEKFPDAPAIVADEAESRGLLSAEVINALAFTRIYRPGGLLVVSRRRHLECVISNSSMMRCLV